MKLKHLILCVVAVPVLAFVIVVAFNLRDEEPLPEVKKLLAWEVPAHGFDDNGYLILRGLGAPADQDAAQFGRKLIDADIATFRVLTKEGMQPEIAAAAKDPESLGKIKAMQCKYTETDNCVDFYLHQDRAQIATLFGDQKLLMERYLAIGKSANFVDVVPPSAYLALPAFHYGMLASELRRMQAVEDVADGKMDDGLHVFIENAQVSRRLLSSSTTLIVHMFALAQVQRDMRLLSELMEKYPQLAERRAELAPILVPIAGPEYSLSHTMDHEIAWHLNTVDGMTKAAETSDRGKDGKNGYQSDGFFFKKNATENLQYRLLHLQQDAIDAGAAQFDKVSATYDDKKREQMGWKIGEYYYFYNPVGKIFAGVAEVRYADYAMRQFDTDGFIRLVALQAKLIADHVPADQVAAAIAQADISLRNPYDGQPMKWDVKRDVNRDVNRDVKSGELSFLARHSSNALPKNARLFAVHLPAAS